MRAVIGGRAPVWKGGLSMSISDKSRYHSLTVLPRTIPTAITGDTVGTAVNFQQIACSFDSPGLLVPRNGIGRYLFHISGCDKLAKRIWRPLVVNRELPDFAMERE